MTYNLLFVSPAFFARCRDFHSARLTFRGRRVASNLVRVVMTARVIVFACFHLAGTTLNGDAFAGDTNNVVTGLDGRLTEQVTAIENEQHDK